MLLPSPHGETQRTAEAAEHLVLRLRVQDALLPPNAHEHRAEVNAKLPRRHVHLREQLDELAPRDPPHDGEAAHVAARELQRGVAEDAAALLGGEGAVLPPCSPSGSGPRAGEVSVQLVTT